MADAEATQEAAPKTTLTLTVNGSDIEANPGELVIAAAERHGVYIPRFCYHPRMRPVGMCRMCLVEVDTGRGPGLQASCMLPVAEGMKVETESPVTKKAQDGVLEFLLINHPLDCPVCDRGGECPLQDQTMAFGPGESRFVEEKRHFEKPIPISETVYLDRERCILCDRCTRFASEVAGDPLISFVDRGNGTQVNTFPDDPFASYFSGNTVQLCPVGALTAKPYRFKARPWDLDQVESTCTTCAVGCRMAIQSSSDRLVRFLGIDVDPVNHGWLCDKGRFGFEWANAEGRLTTPLVREGGGGDGGVLVDASWSDAWAATVAGLSGLAGDRVAVLGGARLTNESAYAWSKLARIVLGTDSVDAQLGDGLPADVVLGLPRATIDATCAADTIVLLGPDLKEELPVLYLRIREAVVEGKAKLVELSPAETGLSRYAATSVRYRPGEAAAAVRELLEGDSVTGTVACVVGRGSLAESAESIVEAASVLLEGAPGARFLPALRRANVLGALDMGLAPGLLPGRVRAADGRAWFTETWGSLPEADGRDAAAILTAAAEGGIDALVLLGADPLADFPDADLARRALERVGFVLAVETLANASTALASVVLPAAGYGEVSGTTTNIEGRVSRLNQKVTPPGTARSDWSLAVELADRMDAPLGFESVEGIWDEIEMLAPSHSGITRARLATAEGLDGVIAGPERPGGEAAESGVTGTVAVVQSDGAPPAMSQADSPEMTAADTHMGVGGVNPSTMGGGEEAPEPESGDASVDAPPQVGEAVGAVGSDAEYQSGQAGGAEEAIEKSVDAEGNGDDTSAFRASGGTTAGARPQRPPLLRHVPSGPSGPAIPVDSSSLRLTTKRRLYDSGTLVQASPSMAKLADDPRLRLSPTDAERLRVGEGTPVRVRTSRTQLELVAGGHVGVPDGVALLDTGPAAAELIDSTVPSVDVEIEAPESAGSTSTGSVSARAERDR